MLVKSWDVRLVNELAAAVLVLEVAGAEVAELVGVVLMTVTFLKLFVDGILPWY